MLRKYSSLIAIALLLILLCVVGSIMLVNRGSQTDGRLSSSDATRTAIRVESLLAPTLLPVESTITPLTQTEAQGSTATQVTPESSPLTLEPTPTQTPQYGTVRTDGGVAALLRSQPNPTASVVDRIPFGSRISILNQVQGPPADEASTTWYQVSYNDKQGYIYGPIMSDISSQAQVAAIPTPTVKVTPTPTTAAMSTPSATAVLTSTPAAVPTLTAGVVQTSTAPSATPAATSTAVQPGYGTVQTRGNVLAIIRTQPSTASAELARIPPGTRLLILGEVQGTAADTSSTSWYQIVYNEQQGFIYAPLLVNISNQP